MDKKSMVKAEGVETAARPGPIAPRAARCRAGARLRSCDGASPARCEMLEAPLSLAGRTARKARGLLFSRPSGGALLLMPCNDVHTVGMRHRLDIAFVDAGGCVVECHRDVGPFRRLRNRRAVAVVERFSSCSSPWFSTGDHVGVIGVEGGRL